MAVVERRIDAPLAAVASILTDPRTYDGVVVGSRRVRWFDARWPEEGTAFHHHIGFGPVAIRDRTVVVDDDLPHGLRVEAGLGPLGSAEVEFTLTPDGDGTRVAMREDGRSGLISRIWSGPLDAVMRARNRVALGRLDELSRARHRARTVEPGRSPTASDDI